jgi:phospholipid-binding lipoprotein MlaA
MAYGLTKSILAACAASVLFALPAAAQGVVGDTSATNEVVAQSDIDSALSGAANSDIADPWEGFNRKMFSAHVFLDRNLLVPAAKGYRATTPKAGRRGIRRFLANIRAPGVFVNDILQGEFGRAGETLSRFVVNSTIGAGGFADPAAQIGIAPHGEDFGQTLAVWGIDSGPYLFLPLVGPSTGRDGFGQIVQFGMDPLFYVRTPPADFARYTRAVVGGVSAREQFLDPLAEIEAKSLDYYASFRSFYTQARKREIANGKVDYSDLPDIGEFEEFDDPE